MHVPAAVSAGLRPCEQRQWLVERNRALEVDVQARSHRESGPVDGQEPRDLVENRCDPPAVGHAGRALERSRADHSSAHAIVVGVKVANAEPARTGPGTPVTEEAAVLGDGIERIRLSA